MSRVFTIIPINLPQMHNHYSIIIATPLSLSVLLYTLHIIHPTFLIVFGYNTAHNGTLDSPPKEGVDHCQNVDHWAHHNCSPVEVEVGIIWLVARVKMLDPAT